jgi:hypothetical protein
MSDGITNNQLPEQWMAIQLLKDFPAMKLKALPSLQMPVINLYSVAL